MGTKETGEDGEGVGKTSSKTTDEWLAIARQRNVSLKLIEGDDKALWVREKKGHFYLGVKDVHAIRPICNIEGVGLEALRDYIDDCEVRAIEADTTHGVGRLRVEAPQD